MYLIIITIISDVSMNVRTYDSLRVFMVLQRQGAVNVMWWGELQCSVTIQVPHCYDANPCTTIHLPTSRVFRVPATFAIEITYRSQQKVYRSL